MTKVSSYTQRAGAIKLAYIEEKIRLAKEQFDVLRRCGLKQEAEKNVLPVINDLEKERQQIIEEADANRLKAVKALLMCFCSADLLTEAADNFADRLNEASRGTIGSDNDFSAMMRQIAADANKAVQYIDDTRNEAMSIYYADMAEDCVSAAYKAVDEVVDKWMNTHKGKQYF